MRLPCLAACELLAHDSNLLWPSSMAPMEEACRNLHNASTLPLQGSGIFIWYGMVTIDSSSIYSNTATNVSALLSEPSWNVLPLRQSKKLPGTFTMQALCPVWQQVSCCGIRPLRSSIAPMDEPSRNLHNASTLPFQGGGICIWRGTVTIQGTSIHGNTAGSVRARFLNSPGTVFHGPDGRNFQEPSQYKHLTSGWWNLTSRVKH